MFFTMAWVRALTQARRELVGLPVLAAILPRAHTTNPERFYRHITTTLADSVTLEKLHAACHEALNATSEARGLHED
jgi:hypothetical protein